MSALRTLLEGRLDYAGLFPPAALGMAEAWHTFQRHRGAEEAWLLGAFVCPANRLNELLAFPSATDTPFAVSLLAGGTEAELESASQDWESFRRGAATAVELRAWELRLPLEAATDPGPWVRRGARLPGRAPRFFEAGGEWSAQALEALARVLEDQREPAPVGLKLRCGGLKPSDLPSVDAVASVLSLASRHQLPLKLTAGLHHPLRHQRGGGPMHGFLNVYLAALAARMPQGDEALLAEVLREEDPGAFTVEAHQLKWRDLELDDQALRKTLPWLAGHGSCSVDEPVEDLKALGWWPAPTSRKEKA